MIKSLELAGPSCLTKSADDEPVFVLCARDPVAPLVVRRWADGYAVSKREDHGVLTPRERSKLEEALALADQMEAWRAANETTATAQNDEISSARDRLGKALFDWRHHGGTTTNEVAAAIAGLIEAYR